MTRTQRPVRPVRHGNDRAQPMGAVPTTPTYQDALKRLYAPIRSMPMPITATGMSRPGRWQTCAAFARATWRHSRRAGDPGVERQHLRPLPRLAAGGAARESGGLPCQVAGRPSPQGKTCRVREIARSHDLIHTVFLVPAQDPIPGYRAITFTDPSCRLVRTAPRLVGGASA